jgi:hypothetical protein
MNLTQINKVIIGVAMSQNIYDDPGFFAGYATLDRSVKADYLFCPLLLRPAAKPAVSAAEIDYSQAV